MPPHPQALSLGRFTFTSDCYSLGMLLWECLTGSTPWLGLQLGPLVYRVCTLRERPPLPPCPPALARLIRHCWAHDPHNRPSSAQVLFEAERMLLALDPAPSLNFMMREEPAHSWCHELQ